MTIDQNVCINCCRLYQPKASILSVSTASHLFVDKKDLMDAQAEPHSLALSSAGRLQISVSTPDYTGFTFDMQVLFWHDWRKNGTTIRFMGRKREGVVVPIRLHPWEEKARKGWVWFGILNFVLVEIRWWMSSRDDVKRSPNCSLKNAFSIISSG